MSKHRLTKLREQLEAERQRLADELRAKIAVAAEELGTPTQSKITDADGLADATAEVQVAMAMRENRELQEIDAALARIADGSYGICADCGGEVGAARLDANPSARRCLPCQEKRERAQPR